MGNEGEEGNGPREPKAKEKEFKKKMRVNNARVHWRKTVRQSY